MTDRECVGMDDLAGRAVLVTGHRGFIGGRLVEFLRRNGVQPTTLDGDVCDPIRWDGPIDIVFHLAGVTSSERFAREPDRSFRSNVCGTLNVLELCRAKNARLIFASTCGVYGAAGNRPVRETQQGNPITAYAWSKWVGEQLCAAYARVHRVPCVILRLFNVYGGGQSGSWLIPYLAAAARAGRMAVLRSAESRRDFVHVSDVERAFGRAAVCAMDFGIFNIGSGKSASVLDVVECLGAAMGKTISYECTPGVREGVEEIVPDLTWATVRLGWIPQTSLEEGLAEVARWVE